MADEENKEAEEANENPDDAEAQGEGEEGDEEGGAKKGKSKKKLIIIIVIAVVLLAGGGAGAFFFLNKSDTAGDNIEYSGEGGEEGSGEEVDGAEEAMEEGEGGGSLRAVYYDMEEFIVNLNVGSKRASFLKMTISLELLGEQQIPRIEEKMPRIRDSFQVYMRELRNEDLQGSAGLYRLREELLLRINKVVYPGKVNDILFKEILVQ